MGNIGLPEVLVIAVIGLLVFGPRKLPEIARNAGRALNEFKRVTGELTEELKAGLEEPAPPAATADPDPHPDTLTHTEMLPLDGIPDGQEDPQAGRLPGKEAKELPPGKDV